MSEPRKYYVVFSLLFKKKKCVMSSLALFPCFFVALNYFVMSLVALFPFLRCFEL